MNDWRPPKYVIALPFLYFLFATHHVLAQLPTEQDCLGAIAICGPVWSTESSTLGTGNYPDEDNPGTCLVPGEYNSTWFVFTVVTSGDLAFAITPVDPGADYDWSLYNLTNASCEDIPTDDGIMASCNSSQWGYTGISSTGIGNFNGPGNTFPFNYLLPVTAGEIYTLNVNNWSVSNGGYTIDFSESTATIYDSVKPKLSTLEPVECNATTITFNFSENILCNTIEDADFLLTGPGGPFTLSNETGFSCANGGTQEKTFSIDISPPLVNGGTYSFSLTGNAGYVTDLCGNVADSSTIVFIAPGPLAGVDSVHQPICSANSGAIFAAGDSGAPPYTYSLNGGSPQSGGAFEGLAAGTYTVTVTDAAGCTDTVQVVLLQGPGGVTASILSSSDLQCGNICDGSIDAGGSGGTMPYTFLWSNGTTAATASGLCGGVYTVTITDALGCYDTASVTLHQPPDVTFDINALTEPSCAGYADGAISVNITGGTPGYTYFWSPMGGTNPDASSLAGGNYTLTITDAHQCVYDTVITLPQPLPVTITPPSETVICAGAAGELLATATGGTPPYNYLWDGSISANPLSIVPAYDTTYTVTATDAHGCTGEAAVFDVTVDQVPVVYLGADSVLCLGDSLPLNAYFEQAQYLWQDGSTNSYFIVRDAGDYSVTVFNTCFSVSDTLHADYYDCSSCVHYPTAFSPDASSHNDVFHALVTCPVSGYAFRVFNRWGQLVFETHDVQAGWDGTYKGKPADIGVYVWEVDYTGIRSAQSFTQQLSGNVTLLR